MEKFNNMKQLDDILDPSNPRLTEEAKDQIWNWVNGFSEYYKDQLIELRKKIDKVNKLPEEIEKVLSAEDVGIITTGRMWNWAVNLANHYKEQIAELEAVVGDLLENAVPVAADCQFDDVYVVEMDEQEWAEVVAASERARSILDRHKGE